MIKQPCEERVKEQWKSRREDLKTLLRAEDNYDEELGSLNEYGLSLSIVEGKFSEKGEDYVRYQISWGDYPMEVLRFYKNGTIEFWLLDWEDDACVDVTVDKIAREIRGYLGGAIPEAPWF